MNVFSIHPLTELRRLFSARRKELQCPRQSDEKLVIDAAEDIASDIGTSFSQIGINAHKAEVYDQEALKAFDAARCIHSDGGESITPLEEKRIRSFVMHSMRCDRAASDLSKVDAT